jgi:hypothetical protein
MRFVCDQGCVEEGTKTSPPPRTCPTHGSPFVYENELRRSTPLKSVSDHNRETVLRRGSTFKRSKGFEASPAQRKKVKLMPCLVCGREATEDGRVVIDPAHVWPQGKGGCTNPDCVFPLCRAADYSCHTLFDEGKLDLLPKLAEQSEAWATELAHPILCHGVTLIELVRRLAGNRQELTWVEREKAA